MTVLVIGGANLDVLARSSGPLRAHTSNPGTILRTYGGVGRNVAENLARLGTPTRMLLAVGDDTAGQEVLARTRFAGVKTLRVPWDGPTGTYTALLDDDGSLVAGVADMAATESIAPEHVDDAGVVRRRLAGARRQPAGRDAGSRAAAGRRGGRAGGARPGERAEGDADRAVPRRACACTRSPRRPTSWWR